MIQLIRQCPDCGRDRLLEQHHAAAGTCQDAKGTDCPEWSCTCCGAALLIGFGCTPRYPAEPLELPDRVA
jgi:hypothetical protein